ncbi:MAG: hypothetical protein CMH57_14435 [Myxococcales bacterium]|nr:hypothetical protein [Myxococcales bacterium]
MTPPTFRWDIRADRRSVDFEHLQAELRELGETLSGLEVELLSHERFLALPDEGAYRDWGPVAVATAADPRILEALAEELILEFGFQIDMYKPEEERDG